MGPDEIGVKLECALIVADGLIETMRKMRRNPRPDQRDERDRIDLERAQDRYLGSFVLSLGGQQVGVPVIAESVAWVALDGATVLHFGAFPVAIKMEANICKRRV